MVFGLVACGGDASPGGGADPDARASAGADATGGGSTDASADAAAPRRVRFVAIGDTGKGNDGQRQVAAAMAQVCATEGCDFVVLLGDNIYDAGVSGVDDPLWQERFEQPYAGLDLPFYAVLGNHDYGGWLVVPLGGLGNEFSKGQHEVAYSQVSAKWRMPATHYTFTAAHVGFIALDTNAILWGDTTYGDQATWLPTATAAVADRRWQIVLGHHPYRSNGEHGNAGNYDAPELAGIPIPNPLPIQNGAAMKDFFDAHVCGIGQVYLTGHDHSRQWLDENERACGMELLVSGAGASVTSLRDRGNRAHYQDASEVGFLHVDIDGDTLRGRFFDGTGALDFERVITR